MGLKFATVSIFDAEPAQLKLFPLGSRHVVFIFSLLIYSKHEFVVGKKEKKMFLKNIQLIAKILMKILKQQNLFRYTFIKLLRFFV